MEIKVGVYKKSGDHLLCICVVNKIEQETHQDGLTPVVLEPVCGRGSGFHQRVSYHRGSRIPKVSCGRTEVRDNWSTWVLQDAQDYQLGLFDRLHPWCWWTSE